MECENVGFSDLKIAVGPEDSKLSRVIAGILTNSGGLTFQALREWFV